MKRVNYYLHYFLLLVIIGSIASCKKEKQDLSKETESSSSAQVIMPAAGNLSAPAGGLLSNTGYNTFYGPVVQMGNGHLRSWINITRDDNIPLAIGIEFTAASLNNLPTDPLNFAANTFVLKLHQKAKDVTPYQHIMVNWEPNGHEPPGIYNVPHFDMHFYKISVADRLAITGVPGVLPPAGYLPASYVIQAATVPQMGTHWLDPSSPELPPTLAPFTYTFIYGSSNGKTIFNEPMITRAFMLGGLSVSTAFPQPLLFSPNNTNYPTVYKIWKSAENGRYYVALTDFIWR